MAQVLRVLLGDLAVGRLSVDSHGSWDFRLMDSYKRAYPRPVLGQVFLDDPEGIWCSRARVPPWFSNLLPEGPLRDLIARQAGVPPSREFFLLRHLGEDLPGGVRIIADDTATEPLENEGDPPDKTGREASIAWHFSLAGVQLKFSARRTGHGLTIPASGLGGNWIVKLPDARFRQVPKIEYATMRWAKASGIEIPEMDLVPMAEIHGLPASCGDFAEAVALAIRRFDRPTPDTRVHMEDFAQIFNLYPERKYEGYSYEAQAKLVMALGTEGDLEQFIRRLVFVVASGNGDAHHKNWSLIYPDGINARLSPAYDLVSTILYLPDDKLALNLGGSKRWQDVTRETFLRMARKIGAEESFMAASVDIARTTILDAWRDSGHEFGFDVQARKNIDCHMARVPLLRP